MNSPTLLLVVLPVTHIFLPYVSPVHSPHSAFHVRLPVAFKVVARWVVVHLAIPIFHVTLEAAFENAPALELYLAFARFLTFPPLAFISSIVNTVFTKSVSEAIFHLAIVAATIRPAVVSLPSNTVISEFPFVNYAICPGEFPLTVQEPVVKVSLVLVAVLKSHFPRPIQTLSVYLTVLRRS